LSYLRNISFKTMYHQAQNTQQNRFQEYSDNYWDIFSSKRTTELIDLSNIKKVPVGLYVGENDVTCTAETAKGIAKDIGAMVKDFTIYPGLGHEDFGQKSDKDFADKIHKLLGNQPEEQETFLQ